MTEAASFSEAPIEWLDPSTIIIPEDRQRTKAKADESLISGIRAHGILNPLIIRDGNMLVAGERRLDAARSLALPLVPIRRFEKLSLANATLIELLENLAREQLSWQDEARAVQTYHRLKLGEYPGWTQLGTAGDLGLSESAISTRLVVAAELGDPAVAGCQTLTAASNYIQDRARRAIAAAAASGHQFVDAVGKTFDPTAKPTKEEATAALIAEATGGAPATPAPTTFSLVEAGKRAAAFLAEKRAQSPTENLAAGPIICANFVDWAAAYDGVPFDVIHCDFPYGKDYKGANTTKQAEQSNPVYNDSAEVLWMLLDAFLTHQDRLCAPQAHCLFWHDEKHEAEIIARFKAAGWRHSSPYPLIWTKGNSGSPGAYEHSFRHCYETAHLFSRGGRNIIKMTQDHFPCPVDEEKMHLSQKPVPMLRHFLSGLCDEHTRLLDPTCGSGSAIAAANLLQVDYAVGVEMDESNAQVARFFVDRKLAEEPKG